MNAIRIIKQLEKEISKNNKTAFEFGGFDSEKDKKLDFLIRAIMYHKSTIDELKKQWGDIRKANISTKNVYKDAKNQLNLFISEAEQLLFKYNQ